MRTTLLAVTLVAACVSISEAQTKTTSPPRDTMPSVTRRPVPEKHGGFYCFFNRNICALDSLHAIQAAAAQDTISSLKAALAKKDTTVCYSKDVCEAKIDSALKVQQASLGGVSVTRSSSQRPGGTRPQTPARTTSRPARGVTPPTTASPVVKDKILAKVDTVWRDRVVIEIDSVFIETIRERVIIQKDTVRLNRLEIREAPRPRNLWPWVIAGTAAALLGTCEGISRSRGNDDWAFTCFGGDEIEIRNRNWNENGGSVARRGIRISLRWP